MANDRGSEQAAVQEWRSKHTRAVLSLLACESDYTRIERAQNTAISRLTGLFAPALNGGAQ